MCGNQTCGLLVGRLLLIAALGYAGVGLMPI